MRKGSLDFRLNNMVTYSYIQDTRTKAELKDYVECGLYNQKLAIEKIVADMKEIGWDLQIEWFNPDEKFESSLDGFTGYNADVRIKFYKNNKYKGEYNCEVKVTDREPSEFIHIKSWQLERLFEQNPNSKILYSTPTKFSVVPVKFILDINDIVLQSEKIGGKKCHRLWTAGMYWIYYSEPLLVKQYPRKKHDKD
jgi:hypothetical protein